jgi:hypothetical protein
MWIPGTHPSGLDVTNQGDGRLWSEYHHVKISTNVKTLEMYGEGKVAIRFPQVTFERRDPCLKEIQITGSGGTTGVFNGRYDGYSFYINELGPEGGFGSITQRWRTEAKVDGECEIIRENNFSFTPFYSLILHGVKDDNPPISYYDILDDGAVGKDSSGLEKFDGMETIINPDPEMGVYPFNRGVVRWNFNHVSKVLPLESE